MGAKRQRDGEGGRDENGRWKWGGTAGWGRVGEGGRSRETLREKRGTEEPPSGTSCSGFVLMCSALRSRFLNFVLSSTHMKGPIRS